MSTYVIDTETNGHHKEMEKPEVIELAIGKITPLAGNLRFSLQPTFEGRFEPVVPSTMGALAMHHILPSELKGLPASALAKAQLPTDMEYVVGHNIDYDADALEIPLGVKRVCTLAMARAIWPLAEHNLGALMYHMASLRDTIVAMDICRERLKKAHSAMADVEFCFELLFHIWSLKPEIETMEQMWQFSEESRIPVIWAFGKHKGTRVDETDTGYLKWCLRQPDMDQYVKLACSRALAKG